MAGLKDGTFQIAQVVTPARKAGRTPAIRIPNPFYHPYAGAAMAAHAEPVFVPALPENRFMPDFAGLGEATLARTAAVYLCSPANPQGAAASMDYLCALIGLARAHDFLLIVDECYAEIYSGARPVGALEACARLGGALDNVAAFHSLSKRSNAPGLRSGFVAGDGRVLERYLLFRNYGCVAVPGAVLAASAALWREATHVDAVARLLRPQLRGRPAHSRQPLRLLSARRWPVSVARRRRWCGGGAPAVDAGRGQGDARRADDPRGTGQRYNRQALHPAGAGPRPGDHHRGARACRRRVVVTGPRPARPRGRGRPDVGVGPIPVVEIAPVIAGNGDAGQRVVAYLAGIGEKFIGEHEREHRKFWRKVDERLDELALDPATSAKIEASVAAGVPRVTADNVAVFSAETARVASEIAAELTSIGIGHPDGGEGESEAPRPSDRVAAPRRRAKRVIIARFDERGAAGRLGSSGVPLRRSAHDLILRNALLDVVEQVAYRSVDLAALHALLEHRAQEFRRTVKGDGEAREARCWIPMPRRRAIGRTGQHPAPCRWGSHR